MVRHDDRFYLNEMTMWGVPTFDAFGLDHIKCHHNTHKVDANKFRVERTRRHLSHNPSTYLR